MACIVPAFVLALCALDHAFGSAVKYTEHRFKTKVDHFSFHNNKTFEMRYLLGDQHWDRDGGPIFIYTGNENDIEGFALSAGLLWEWAPEFSALVIFAEHRFFGSSLPFGDRSFESPNHLGYLTSEQAMADYADLLLHLKYTLPGARKSPVVAFGGSYGAMLAAWMRYKYPHLVDAALASGGPFKMPPGLAPCSTYSEAVTKAYRAESEACVEAIRQSWLVMERLASTVSGCELLRKKFNTCQPLHPDNYTIFRDTVRDTYGVVAMANYPDAADLVGSLPANPVKVVCERFVNAPKTKLGLVDAAAQAMGMFMAGNSTRQCLDVFFYKTGLRTYQFMTCTVLMQPFCGNGVSDMFYPFTWNAMAEKERCQREFGITPDFYGTILMYGGSEFSTATNIIFSNGELDPWSAFGILEPPSDDVVVLEIPGAAHHTDLRFASPVDSEAVKEARKVEKNYIRQWIAARDSRPAEKLRVVARRARSGLLREHVFQPPRKQFPGRTLFVVKQMR